MKFSLSISVATNRIVLKVKLAAAFYQVSQAVTGAEALERVRRSPPSLIILGGSNDMPAAQLCREFRKLSATENCPIIVQTIETGAEFRLEILAAGASAILEQPCCDALLLARLRSLSRAQETATELRMRESTHRALGLAEIQSSFDAPAKIGVMAVNRRGVAWPHGSPAGDRAASGGSVVAARRLSQWTGHKRA
ncbi:hypothetical protein [Phaeobacter sp. J2-8]|uniref:response regulator n=1 Tax=Phaeobacter sp. J2-8 TaxID=2931394 RepID=UPI001FD5708C|nr:hypothetical protein [Phaeobacter sp. J2-8]MCJ7871905.1 hypothetical protein [Phaeobacter sp. J2-8]